MQTIWSNVLYFCHLFCNDFPLSDLVRSFPVSIFCFFELFLPSSFLIPDQVCLQSTYDDDDDEDDNDDNDDDGDDDDSTQLYVYLAIWHSRQDVLLHVCVFAKNLAKLFILATHC